MRLRFGFVLVMLVVVIGGFINAADAQRRINGKYIDPGTIPNIALAADIIGGEELEEPSWEMYFPVVADSMATGGQKAGGGWVNDGTNPAGTGIEGYYPYYKFDADGGSTGDDIVYLTFPVPAQYEVDTATLRLYWFHLDDNGAVTDGVSWDGTVQAVGVGEDLYAAGTAMDAVETICTAADSALYITSLDIEVEAIASNDLVTIKLWVDESASELDSGEYAYLIGAVVRLYFKYDD